MQEERAIERTLRQAICVCAAVLLISTPRAALAADDGEDAKQQTFEETDQLPAVQNRRFRMEHEFAVGVGTLPVDPFTKGLALSGGYGWHITDLWAIHGQFNWVFNFSSSLRDKLEKNFGEPDTKFVKINLYGMLGTLFKPLYGKLAFLNDVQIYGEFYLSAYAVIAQLEGGKRTEDETNGKGKRLAVGGSPGFGFRAFINRYLSVRFDMNWMVLLTGGFLSESSNSPFEVQAPLTMMLNFAFTTRSDL